MGILTDIFKGVTKPGRDLLEIQRLIGTARKMDPNINKNLNSLEKRIEAQKAIQEYQPMLQSQEEQLGMFLRPGETALRNAATVGSMIAPVGIAGNIASRAGAGALGGALGSYGMTPITEDASLGRILGGAGLGALVGGTIGAVEKGIAGRAAKLGKTGKVAKYGQELRGEAIGLDPNKMATRRGTGISSATQGKQTIKGFLNTMDELGIPVDTSTMASVGSDDALRTLGGQFDDILGQADEVVKYTNKDTGKLVNKIQDAFKNNPSIAKNAQYQELMGDLLGLGDNYTPSQLNMVREKARELINWSTTSKAGVSERASRKVFEVIDDFFKQSVPQSKEVLAKMRDIYTVRPFLQAKAPSAGTMPLGTASTHIEIPTGGLQERIPSTIGKTLQKGVSLPKVPQVSPEVLSKLGTAGIFGTRLGQAIGYEGQPMEQQMQQPQQLPQGVDNQGVSALNMMLAQEVLNGNISATEANAVLSLLGMGGTGGTSKGASQGQMDAQNAIDMTARLSSSLSGRQLTGPLKGLMGLNPYATEQQDLQAEIDLARQIIGKFLEGGVLRKEDEEKYKKILPTMYDTQEVAQRKLENLVIELQNRQKQYQQTGYAGYGSSANDESLYNAGY